MHGSQGGPRDRPRAAPTHAAEQFTLAWLAQVAARCNADARFVAAAERFDDVIELRCGPDTAAAALLRVRHGEVVGLERRSGEAPQTPQPSRAAPSEASQTGRRGGVTLVADADVWRALRAGLHGGLHRAWRHQMVRFDGDPELIFAHWLLLWRLGANLRDRGPQAEPAVSPQSATGAR